MLRVVTLLPVHLLLAIHISNAYAGVSPDMQKSIRSNTFEVVMKKPGVDTATYEKPLPLELLPFRERNDAYRSVGTAFAIGHNTYVTAAHVFTTAVDSLYGNPELRGPDNTVYAIDRILRFSQHEDYVVFSLLHDPSPAGFLVNREAHIDEPVLAVGNALGEGIVIRDGLYTSATEEEQDGKWKWIRFSAAASPGNSGGPLLDADGRVIGIVIGKSPNENLNFALPIERVLEDEGQKAKFDQRSLISLPYLHGTYSHGYQDGFNLPLAWPAFVDTYQALLARHNEEARKALLAMYRESLFPQGPGAESLLFDPDANGFNPYLMTQQADDAWTATKGDYVATDLPGDGSVSVASVSGVNFLRLIRPDGAAGDAFYSDSKSFMDVALKALNLRRSVGQDQVRITSLGSAKSDAPYLDPYDRRWEERVWAVPFLDLYVLTEVLPTPDGCAAIIDFVPAPFLREGQARIRLFAAQTGISYRGSLLQWEAFLRRRSLLPNALMDIRLVRSPAWRIESPRFTFAPPASTIDLSEKSILTMTMGFGLYDTHARWEIDDVWWMHDERMNSAIGLWRRKRPPPTAKIDLRNGFATMRDRVPPYDGAPNRDSAETFAMTRILEVPGTSAGTMSADLLYGLTFRLVADLQKLPDANRALQSAIEGIHILEHGVGKDMVGATQVNAQNVDPSRTAWRPLSSVPERDDREVGQDIRGRTLSQDIREFEAAYQAKISTLEAGGAAATQYDLQQRQQFEALIGYWNNYPALTHNREMWHPFLSRNRLPPDTPHDKDVANAEQALLVALGSGAPSPQWSERARELLSAYIGERSRLVKIRPHVDVELRGRKSPCPAPTDSTSGKKSPIYSRMTRSLEDFWPFESRRLGEEGIVMADVRISATGCAVAAAIAASSGSEMLDEAVMRFYETIEFLPGEIDGKAIESTVTMPIVFKLKQ